MIQRITSRASLFVLGALLAVAGAAYAADPTVMTSLKLVPDSIETTAFEVTNTSGVSQFSIDNAGATTFAGAHTLNGDVTLGDAATDVLTVNATVAGASPLVFEGSTADAYETTITVTQPATSDKSIALPNASGTFVVSATSPLAVSAAGDMSLGDVALGSGTSGNFVLSTATGTGLTGGAAGSEGAALTLALDYSATIGADPALTAGQCVFSTTGLIAEGGTPDGIETLLTFADPTVADNTITVPNASGTVAVSTIAPIALSAGGQLSIDAAGILATDMQAAPTDLGNQTVTVDLSNSNGANVTDLTTDGTITAPTFAGNASSATTAAGLSATLVATSGGTGQSTYAVGDLLVGGAANTLDKLADVAVGSALISGGIGVAPSWGTPATATALAADPADCGAGEYATGIAASGALTCATTVDLADAATALAADPADCSAGELCVGTGTSGACVCDSTPSVGGLATFDASVDIKNGAASAGVLSLYEDSDDGAHYASFQVPALAANTVYTLPADDGDAGEQLQTNGSGTLTWEAAGAGGLASTDCAQTFSLFYNPTETGGSDDYVSLNKLDAVASNGSFYSTTEGDVDTFIFPAAVTLHTLRVGVDVAPGAGNDSWTITLREGGVSQALTCEIDEAATSCTGAVASAIAAGAAVNVFVNSNAQGAAADPTAAGEMVISFCVGAP